MEVSLPTDADGFLSRECPSCELRFKVRFGEGSDEPISYCPYCGHNGQSCWHTPEQVRYFERVATNEFVIPEIKKLERKLSRSMKGMVQISKKASIPSSTTPPMETDEVLDILRFPCCNETAKLVQHDHHFCLICGENYSMDVSSSTKVFLSHKGIDKGMVTDFKDTLSLIGYETWIDEDAMPAGTPLERALLQGMKDSCAAVFFITPSYKDEGFLETEVNYAIQEKRQKGDRFSLIALQFVDENGNVGEIPELLKPYVWKKPTTHLAALREVIRALPLATVAVDWRDSVTGVVTKPTIRSTETDLSDEAKAILEAAAAGDGRIMHSKYLGGEDLTTNGKSLFSDKERRTIARWVGGLEDLQRRRFIRDLGHKGEVFEVTREGYEAVDQIGTAASAAAE